jgi:hypothetical protein
VDKTAFSFSASSISFLVLYSAHCAGCGDEQRVPFGKKGVLLHLIEEVIEAVEFAVYISQLVQNKYLW